MPNMINGMTPITYSPQSMDNYILNPYQYGTSYIPADFGMIANKGGNSFLETMGVLNEGLGSVLGGPLGSLIGAGMNFIGGQINADIQQKRQEEMYKKFMSPQARMRDMIEAGINPAAAAQGISGSGPASMPSAPAASPASPNLGEQLGQSQNTMMSAKLAKEQADLLSSQKELTESQNTEQVIKNRFIERQQLATLMNIEKQNEQLGYVCDMLAVDDYYKGAEAAAHWQQTRMSLIQMSQQIVNLNQEYFNMLAQEALIMEQAGLTHNQAVHELHKIGLTDAQINEVYHNIDLIDATKLLTETQVDEVSSRTRLNNAHAWYQEKINSIWANSGYNMNSDWNSNFYANLMSGNKHNANNMLLGMKAYILNEGEARFESKDYMMDKAMGIIEAAGRIASFGLLGNGGASYTPVGNSVPGAKLGPMATRRMTIHPSMLIQN